MEHFVKTDSYVSVDLETTGLDPKTDRIIEIGAVKVEKGIRTGIFETFVNPGRKLTERVAELTGIRDEDLAEAPVIQEVLPRLLEFMEDRLLLGHSILFDYAFLKRAAVNERLPFERQGLDTLKIARSFLPELESRRLDYLCTYYGIPHRAHRALADAEATAVLYDRLYAQFHDAEGAKKQFAPFALRYHAKRDTPATPAQKERLYQLLDRHKLKVEYEVDMLTRSEASRYTDRILAEYGR